MDHGSLTPKLAINGNNNNINNNILSQEYSGCLKSVFRGFGYKVYKHISIWPEAV